MDMALVGLVALLGAAIVLAARASGVLRPPASRTWRVAARRLGLTFEEGKGTYQMRMSGVQDGMTIKVDYQRPLHRAGALYDATPTDHNLYSVWSEEIPQDLRVMPETTAERSGLRRPDLEVADPAFDQSVFLRGVESRTLAVLDAETRRLLMEFVRRWGGQVRLGALAIDDRELFPRPEEIEERVRTMCRLAARLRLRGRSVPALLSRNGFEDGVREVRYRNLEVLFERYPQSAEAPEACARVLAAPPDAEFRLLAARAAGAAGHPHLEALFADPTAGAEVRAGALAAIVERFPPARAIELADAAFSGDDLVLRRAAIRAYGSLRHRPAFAAVVACARPERNADAATQEAIAEALGDFGEAAAEPVLAGLLADGQAPVRAAAARALGRVGTLAAIEPLTARTRTGVFGETDEVRKAAREAITALRKRFGVERAQAGRLTVFAGGEEGGDAGALSVAHDPTGALSPAPERSEPDGAGEREPIAEGGRGSAPKEVARPREPPDRGSPQVGDAGR
ncbi:MAG: HEAT repeat domain-containing protein [Planctomycetes bacterium]|nr:HEAT repeat domain-containing protein [Planctomycetota bacterium]